MNSSGIYKGNVNLLVIPKKAEIAPDALAIISQASALISKAKTLDEAKNLKSLLDFAQKQAREKKLESMEKEIVGYKFMLKDKVGEMLVNMKEKGELNVGRPEINGTSFVPLISPKTLADLHMTKNESAQAQQFHKLPEPEKAEVIKTALEKVGQKRVRRLIIEGQSIGKITGREIDLSDHMHEFLYCDCGEKIPAEFIKASELS